MDFLLRCEDIAELLHISAQTARRMMREGKLPAVKIGARWYVPENALASLLAEAGDDHAA